jgi:ABC-type antimicrobial peptide transport system permease subunit
MLAIALAIAGLWSSVSYAVSQRTNEFAIRLAIGAGRTSLVTLVLGDGVRTATIAVGAGIIIAAIASGFIADLLFEVSPRDPAVFGAVGGAVLAVATLASLLPAWRATRIQPVEALRAD